MLVHFSPLLSILSESKKSFSYSRSSAAAISARISGVYASMKWRVGVVEFDKHDATSSRRPLPPNGNSLTGVSRCSIFAFGVFQVHCRNVGDSSSSERQMMTCSSKQSAAPTCLHHARAPRWYVCSYAHAGARAPRGFLWRRAPTRTSPSMAPRKPPLFCLRFRPCTPGATLFVDRKDEPKVAV